MRIVLASSLLLAACVAPRPLPTAETAVIAQAARRFDGIFPARDAGVVRPRFGVPAIVTAGDEVSFPIAILERGRAGAVSAALVRGDATTVEAARCVDGLLPRRGECVPLALGDEARAEVDAGHALRVLTARSAVAPDPRGWDLVVRVGEAALERAPRAVFVRAPSSGPLSVVQLSDLHVGRPGQAEVITRRLDRLVREINTIAPDVVVVTGDLAEQGRSGALERQAREALQRIDAPVLVILGNHDYGHFPRLLHPEEPDRGWAMFARNFHPLRRFRTVIGGWDFIAFDSGPSVFSPWIRTRGVDDETLGWLKEGLEAAQAAGHGAVLFSHAPTRAALSDRADDRGSHLLGVMDRGAAAVEQMLREASGRGQRVVHLGGHTHWSDLFVEDSAGWARVPFSRLGCPIELGERAALVNAPSATRVSFRTLAHGSAWGLVYLRLDATGVQTRFVQFDRHDRPLSTLACR